MKPNNTILPPAAEAWNWQKILLVKWRIVCANLKLRLTNVKKPCMVAAGHVPSCQNYFSARVSTGSNFVCCVYKMLSCFWLLKFIFKKGAFVGSPDGLQQIASSSLWYEVVYVHGWIVTFSLSRFGFLPSCF